MNKSTVRFLRDVFAMLFAIFVLLFIPYQFGQNWLWISWMPALYVYFFMSIGGKL